MTILGPKVKYCPPKQNGEFVAAMENVLETYHLPHDPAVPVVVMDEQPVQLFKEVRQPIAATRHHPKRVDYESACMIGVPI